jgi:hypothetical protein
LLAKHSGASEGPRREHHRREGAPRRSPCHWQPRSRASLLRFGLVDRLNLWLYPLLLGSGKQVFAGGTIPTALRLTESVTYPNGTLQLAYQTAGTPTYGNLAIEADDLQRLTGED